MKNNVSQLSNIYQQKITKLQFYIHIHLKKMEYEFKMQLQNIFSFGTHVMQWFQQIVISFNKLYNHCFYEFLEKYTRY